MKLAELLIEMKANTASLEKGLNQADRKVTEFATHTRVTVEGLRGNLAELGLAFAGLSLGAAAKELVDFNDQMAHMAQATGMSIGNFSALTYALKPFDIQINQVSEAFAYFDKILSGLVRSKAGVLAIQQLGLSLKDLQKMDPHAALLKVADAFQKMKDGSQKAGISAALFTNTVGFEMIPFLDQGSSGIAALEAQAKKLGVTLSDDDVKATEQEKQALVELEGAFRGVEESIARHAFPALSEWTAGLMGSELNAHAALDRLKLDFLGFASVVADAFGVGLIPGVMSAMAKKVQDISDDLTRTEAKIAAGIHMPTIGSGGQPLIPAIAPHQRRHRADMSGIKEAAREEQKFLEDEFKLLNRMNEIASREAQKTSNLSKLTGDLSKLNSEITDTGANILGLGTDFRTAFRQAEEAAAGLGGPIGGATPGFQKKGFGAMRFDMEKLRDTSKQWGKEMSQSFTRMIETGQGFHQMLGDLLRQFETFIIKATIFKALGSSLSGSGGFLGSIGGFFSGLALPGRASGGPVTAGSLYMVGEQGPEMFAPGMSGSIIPGGMSGGRGGDINIDARGAAPGVEHRIMRVMQAMQKRSTGQSLAALHEYQARGGTL